MKPSIPKEHIEKVKLIARKIARRLPSSVQLDDVIADGFVGYVKACKQFDPTKSSHMTFEKYAEIRIRGEILDGLRRLDLRSSRARTLRNRVQEAFRNLANELGREPTNEEIADRIEISVQKVEQTLQSTSIQFFEPNSQVLVNAPDHSTSYNSMESLISDMQRAKRIELALQRLEPIQRYVVTEYFFEERKQVQIAQDLNVTDARVLQIRESALIKLRKAYEEILAAEKHVVKRAARRPDIKNPHIDDDQFDITERALNDLLENW